MCFYSLSHIDHLDLVNLLPVTYLPQQQGVGIIRPYTGKPMKNDHKAGATVDGRNPKQPPGM